LAQTPVHPLRLNEDTNCAMANNGVILSQVNFLALALLVGCLNGATALQPRKPVPASATVGPAVQKWQQPPRLQQHSKGSDDPHVVAGGVAALQHAKQQRPPVAAAVESQARGSRFKLVPLGAAVLLYVVTSCVLLVTTVLVLACLYDAAARWLHRARFYSCVRKIRQVHEVFRKRKGEQLLCPYCVEPISSSSKFSKPVVFMCGHRFHKECANRWFVENPDKSGRCPTCETIEVSSHTKCESLAFILVSLRRRYPDIISEENVNRWSSCHTEIWLAELRCPRYNSILRGEK